MSHQVNGLQPDVCGAIVIIVTTRVRHHGIKNSELNSFNIIIICFEKPL